ncbi:MAG: Uma2 family endonuclease [Chitinophagaceae bacterium]|nr:Uma2 family endonuclease [Polaromonas sp.]
MTHALLKPLKEDDYLAGEMLADVRHEFVNGGVYAMAGASENHNRVSGNLYSKLVVGADQSCRPFMSDMKLRLDSGNVFYYPDVMLVCDASDNEPYFKTSPCMIAEVLSLSTELTDRREKWAVYQKLQSLREYVLLAQDRAYIEVYQRVNLSQWGMAVLGMDDTLVLTCGDISVPVRDLYRGVDFSVAA